MIRGDLIHHPKKDWLESDKPSNLSSLFKKIYREQS